MLLTAQEHAVGQRLLLIKRGGRPMKSVLALVFALAATAAAAKPSPVEPAPSANPIALARTSAEFNIGPAGATLERNYFRAPEADSRLGLYLCRFEPSMFAKVRLTQSCR
jgi:hypothetical protein